MLTCLLSLRHNSWLFLHEGVKKMGNAILIPAMLYASLTWLPRGSLDSISWFSYPSE